MANSRWPDSLMPWLGWNTQGDLGPYTFYTSKRRKLVWFLRAPPLTPASYRQSAERNRFRLVAMAWHAATSAVRVAWLSAARTAGLAFGGYALYTYYMLSNDTAAIQTIERRTRIKLISPA